MTQLTFSPNASAITLFSKLEGSQGKTRAKLVFDTGSYAVLLSWKIALAIGLPIDPNKTLRITTASMVETAPVTLIPRMNVLGHIVENVECIIRDLPEGSGVDGLLGLSFLRHFNITLNFEKGFLELEPIKK